MKTDKLYFKYKDTDILLSEYDRIKSSDGIKYEFKEKIEALNLKYSFCQLFRLDEKELKGLDFSIVCDGKDIPIDMFVSDHKDFVKKLNNISPKMVSAINLTPFINTITNSSDIIIIIETLRLFKNLHETFFAARFNLSNAHLILHPSSTSMWENGESSQFWLRSLYLNNAIIWYNSCFDLVLECLWVAKKIFLKVETKKIEPSRKYIVEDFGNGCREDIFIACQGKKIEDLYPKVYSDYINKRNTKVANWANKLKHRYGLRYSETFQEGGFSINFSNQDGCIYDSRKTLNAISFETVLTELQTYNNQLIALITDVQKDILKDFEKEENQLINIAKKKE